VKPEWVHFSDPVVAPGEAAPGFSLPTPDGATTVSLDLFRGRPLVLVFGSWT
jgi:peroxiredoxin